MKLPVLWLLLLVLFTACTSEEPPAPDEAFYKLYGNGTYQEAVSMSRHPHGGMCLMGNQFVRNQDSSALIMIRTDAAGNQLWSRRFFGMGVVIAKSMLTLPNNEMLVLASSRASEKTTSVPVLYRVSESGELLAEKYFEEEDVEGVNLRDEVEDMVLGADGTLFMAGNRRTSAGVAQEAYLKKIDLVSGEILDSRTFSNSEMTELKRIFRNGNNIVVIGNTRQEFENIANQSLFAATFSENLVEVNHAVFGSSNNDTFTGAMINSANEIALIYSETAEGASLSRGVLGFLEINSLNIRHSTYLDFSNNEIPQAIEEDEQGNYLIAVNSFSERGRANILIKKLDRSGTHLWEVPREVGGDGSDKIAQLKMVGDYAFLFSTLDMQNENTLMCLSKIKF